MTEHRTSYEFIISGSPDDLQSLFNFIHTFLTLMSSISTQSRVFFKTVQLFSSTPSENQKDKLGQNHTTITKIG